jgi:hypothetical protein
MTQYEPLPEPESSSAGGVETTKSSAFDEAEKRVMKESIGDDGLGGWAGG